MKLWWLIYQSSTVWCKVSRSPVFHVYLVTCPVAPTNWAWYRLVIAEIHVCGSRTPVVEYTDHNPLTFLSSLQSPNQRLVWWSLFLQAKTITTVYEKLNLTWKHLLSKNRKEKKKIDRSCFISCTRSVKNCLISAKKYHLSERLFILFFIKSKEQVMFVKLILDQFRRTLGQTLGPQNQGCVFWLLAPLG